VSTIASSSRKVVREFVADTRERIRTRGRAAFFRALRLSGAAVASWVVAHWLSPNTVPILAPLTAVLVVQVTLSGTLRSGFDRVLSVVAGVMLAVIFSAVVGLTWWSLGLLVAVSIVIGQLLKLGANLVEVPISAMLVLAVGGAGAGEAAAGRAYETLIGAIAGMAANIVFPPAVKSLDAGALVERFAVRIAVIVETAATQLAAGPAQSRAKTWLEEARRLSRHVPGLDQEVTAADESRQLNLRALGTPRTTLSLRDGLNALEHSLVLIRSLFRSMADGLRDLPGPSHESEADYTDDVRKAFALLLHDLALCLRFYGGLVRAQVEHDAAKESAELAGALQALREARARVTELLLLGPRSDPEYWELNVTLLSTVERILRELDVEEYVRTRERHLAEQDREAPHLVAERLRERARKLGAQAEQALEVGRLHADDYLRRPHPEE
jgi:uncharacterized membrane protein YccC